MKIVFLRCCCCCGRPQHCFSTCGACVRLYWHDRKWKEIKRGPTSACLSILLQLRERQARKEYTEHSAGWLAVIDMESRQQNRIGRLEYIFRLPSSPLPPPKHAHPHVHRTLHTGTHKWAQLPLFELTMGSLLVSMKRQLKETQLDRSANAKSNGL